MQKLLNKIICGDCIEVLDKVSKPFADLIFADPPFNIGYKYDKYYDRVKKKNYIAWTRSWMSVCKKVLKPHGSFYIAIGDEYAANVKIIADELGLFMRNWIIWHYTFGQAAKRKFARSHTHIFYFVNDKNRFTFNDYAVRLPSDRQLIYNDTRANPLGKMPDDVWRLSRVCGTFKERAGWHPCQMPENLLKRIIAVSSNPGDCVLDPFSGSGTTIVAAYSLGRNYVGIDTSANYVENAKKRLASVSRCSSPRTPRSRDATRDTGHGRRNTTYDIRWTRYEIDEMKRLVSDMGKMPGQVAADRNLAQLFTNQFRVRMNNKKHYQVEDVITALRDLAVEK